MVLCNAIGNPILSDLLVPEPMDKRPPTWLSSVANIVCLIQPEGDHSIEEVIIWQVPHGRVEDTQHYPKIGNSCPTQIIQVAFDVKEMAVPWKVACIVSWQAWRNNPNEASATISMGDVAVPN